MGEVVDLNPEPELGYWHCNCGCSTFYVRTDEYLECASCKGLAQNEGHWRKPESDEPPRDEIDGDPPGTIRKDLNDPGEALASVLRFCEPVGTFAVVVLKTNGEIHAWGQSFDTRTRRGWLRRKLEAARELLVSES